MLLVPFILQQKVLSSQENRKGGVKLNCPTMQNFLEHIMYADVLCIEKISNGGCPKQLCEMSNHNGSLKTCVPLREKNNFQHYIGGQPFMKDPKLWSLPQINFAF